MAVLNDFSATQPQQTRVFGESKISKYLGTHHKRYFRILILKYLNGQFVTLTGRSGSGKKYLFYLLGSLDRPTRGVIEMNGRDLASMNSQEIHAFRNQNLGFIFNFIIYCPS